MATVLIWILLGLAIAWLLLHLGWRWASRIWQLHCPAFLAWSFENPLLQKLGRTETTLGRLGLQPGMKVVEIGPGPGRLLIPAAQRVLPGGEAFGIEIQPAMLERLKANAVRASVGNLTLVLGDATQPHLPEGSVDLVYLCLVLGEIPDRQAALAQCFCMLRPGGILSITERFGDPHYQARSVVRRLGQEAGFRLQSIEGGWWFFTATFVKPPMT
jgi:SAM-dependent methyltransferase